MSGEKPFKPSEYQMMSKPLLSSFSSLLGDLAAQETSAHAQFVFAGLQKEGIEATTVFNGAQSGCGNTQAETLAESIGDQRDLAEIRKEPALGLVVGVADVVARLDALAGQFAYTGHGYTYFVSSVSPLARHRQNRGGNPTGHDWKVAVL
nr:50S ribosomal protein L28 (AF212041) [imported] - Agrobacterium tumefaciens (strain C58, Cereon) [Agrobacterium tumefaciens]